MVTDVQVQLRLLPRLTLPSTGTSMQTMTGIMFQVLFLPVQVPGPVIILQQLKAGIAMIMTTPNGRVLHSTLTLMAMVTMQERKPFVMEQVFLQDILQLLREAIATTTMPRF